MSNYRFSRIELKNWMNFTKAEVDLPNRVFVVGPNASGKSNFLDSFRFLRDLVVDGGGLAQAVASRDGISKVRSLFARGAQSEVIITATLQSADGGGWRYELAFTHKSDKAHTPMVARERVDQIRADGTKINKLVRPDAQDKIDPKRLESTHIQQVNANKEFRDVADYFREVAYLHLVPQVVKERQSPQTKGEVMDPYGRDLLDRIRKTPQKIQRGRLGRIQGVLSAVASQLEELDFYLDEDNRPRLRAKFKHWRPRGAYQYETQFSDGTLRLIGLLWALQEKRGPLLLEEPELSLHSAIVKRLAPFIARVQRSGPGRQVLLTTHSVDLLTDAGISPEEIILIQPSREGSEAIPAARLKEVISLMHAGIPASEAVLPRTEYEAVGLFDELKV
jgi:predicted ATPase